MSKADDHHIATRRNVLLAAAAAPVVALPAAALFASEGSAEPVSAMAGPIGDDAELIRLCSRICAIEAEHRRLFETEETSDDEARNEAAHRALYDERETLTERLVNVEITTSAGVLAIARAAMAEANRKADGSVIAYDVSEWMTLSVARFVARDPTPIVIEGWQEQHSEEPTGEKLEKGEFTQVFVEVTRGLLRLGEMLA